MNRTSWLAIPALICALTAAPAAGAPQEPAGAPAATGAEGEAAEAPLDPLERIAQLALPGEFHSYLEPHAGDWDLTIRMWQSLDGEPLESKGRAEVRWILGERFLEAIYRGEIMGQPFEARSVEGYDNQAKQFVRTWWDTMGTYTLLFRGTCDATCKVRTLSADFTDPLSLQKLRIKSVLRLGKKPEEGSEEEEESEASPPTAPVPAGTAEEGTAVERSLDPEERDNFVYETFIVMPDGSEFKNMEFVAERRAS